MSWLRFLHRKRSDAELQDEIEAFLTEETADNEARGMSPDEARRQARLKFGNPQKVRESLWTQNTPQRLAGIARDVKYAFRTLSRTPGFSIIAIVVMALCLVAATSLFTVVRSVLLRPLPFRDPARLVMVYEHFRGGELSYHPVAPADFYDWRSKTHGFEDMAIMRPAGYNLTGVRNELPEQVGAEAGSSNLFSLLGVHPALGRDFTEADDQRGSAAVMLTWSLFERRFAGDAKIVGGQIHLDDRPYTVVGVLLSRFNPEKQNAFNEALLARVRAMPGVHSAALGTTVPGTGYWGTDEFTVKEHPPLKVGEHLPDALTRWVDPGYFSALGIPLVSGRFFTSDERVARSYKVIVSRQLVQQYFAGENPIGKHLHVPARAHDGAPNLVDWEIVGVVGDTLYQVGKEPKATMYFPILEGRSGATLAVHTATDPLQFSVPLQKQIASLDPELPVSDVLTINQIIGASLVNTSLSATLVLAFAILSLILASVGLYGVLSYLTTQRTSELGIRMALGAQRDQLLQLMLMDGLQPALFGLGLGLVMSFAATRIFQSMLFGTKPLDPVVLSGVIVTLLAVAVFACFVPAWRASRINPTQALRTE